MTLCRRSLFLFFVVAACNAVAAEWSNELWLGRGDVWRSRFPVTLANPSDEPLEGVPVALTVGDAPGQAPLAGVRAEALRVTDARGTQLLFGLRSPDRNALFTTGAIPAGATLTLPAVCNGSTTTTYFVYFDNPHAWGLADSFDKQASTHLNGDFENGIKGAPLGWQANQTTGKHRLAWSSEKPFSGTHCLKAEADAEAEKSWFGFVRSDFAVVPGAHCKISVRVRGQNVRGNAGWYVHVGDDKNTQRINHVARTGDGTFDWKEQVITFTVPEGATRMQTGSVLFGTGTAWYDAFSFETDKQPLQATARAGAVERLSFSEQGANAAWIPSAIRVKPNGFRRLFAFIVPAPDTRSEWLYRLPVRVTNLRDEASSGLLAVTDLNSAARGIAAPEFLLTLNGVPVDTCRLGDRLLFTSSPAAHTALTYYLYVGDTGEKAAPVKSTASALGSDIPSDQILEDSKSVSDTRAFAKLLTGSVNLIKNPDFEVGASEPDAWTHSAADASTTFALGTPGAFGKRYARMTVSTAAKEAWRGWYQSIPVKPSHTYLYGAWLACENLEGSANLNAHLRNAKGTVVSGGFLGAGSPISGNTAWTPMFGTATVPPDATQFQMHLTMNDRGTLKHDGVFLAECLNASTGDPESPPLSADELAAWPVDPVVKVFHETQPRQNVSSPFSVSLARNEEEALQIALRSGRDIPNVRVEVEAPKGKRGAVLTDFSVGWVGYVPIDHRTAYYNLTTPPWELKYPSSAGQSDGWSGWWPDPIRPTANGSLTANQTQPIWVSFKTSAETPAGRYTGKILLTSNGRILQTIPFAVTVWGFALPQNASCAAIFDLRLSEQWLRDGTPSDLQRDRMMRFMASKKVCPDGIDMDPPFKRDAQGQITCDFTAYDKAAQRYFDELKFPTSYMPNFFYLFGWEHPPKNILGEKPFEGEYPYTGTDRTQLRHAYKDAYQTCLRLYWDHVKAKGWSDRLVLYISDEPFLTKMHIIDQMKALCAMIHEVDPKIRIYCSTWRHCPDWNGYLNIWGVGHYGCFPVSEMQARRTAGEHIWFTTDGQMCTDTPFCAVERLLPHYCFKYGADAYEFWGISWLTYDPWQFGWHSYIHQSSTPGESYYVRYPNGDGFLLYPGAPIGVEGPVTTVRLEAARDGVEDYEYLRLLKARSSDPEAARLLTEFSALIDIPNAGGRFSTKILPDSARLAALRLQAGEWLSNDK
jgi:hypothetical protein